MPGSRPSESAPGVENATGLVKRCNITRIDDAVGEPLYSYGGLFEFVCRSTNNGSQALDRGGGLLVCVQQTLFSLRSKGKQKSPRSQHDLHQASKHNRSSCGSMRF